MTFGVLERDRDSPFNGAALNTQWQPKQSEPADRAISVEEIRKQRSNVEIEDIAGRGATEQGPAAETNRWTRVERETQLRDFARRGE